MRWDQKSEHASALEQVPEVTADWLAHLTVVQVQLGAVCARVVSFLSSNMLCCLFVAHLVDVDALQLVGERAQVFFNSVDAIEVFSEEAVKLVQILWAQLGLMGFDPLAPS